jgi:hypothetical protein
MATKLIQGGVYGGSTGLTQLGIPMISTTSGQDFEDSGIRYVAVTIPAASALVLRATPYEIVPAPGAAKFVLPIMGSIALDYGGTAYTESGGNLALKYDSGSGAKCSDDIEATGFADVTADTITSIIGKKDTLVAAASMVNKAVVLHNIGGGEWANSGNSPLYVKLYYMVLASGL